MENNSSCEYVSELDKLDTDYNQASYVTYVECPHFIHEQLFMAILLDIHTYNWGIQHFSQDYNLVSHTTYVVCFNLIHTQRNIQFKVDSERQIVEDLFMAILFALRVLVVAVVQSVVRRFISRRILGSYPRSVIKNEMQKNISSAITSQQISGKNSERK